MANHTFVPLEDNPNKCNICLRGHNTHGQCDCCPNQDTLVKFKTMNMCLECYDKEKALTETSALNADNRVADLNATIRESQAIDNAIKVRTDLFNAATIAIADIKATIDADNSITNKQVKLAEVLMERFNHFKTVSFELQEKLVEAGNHQKAIQVHLNQLANQLRSEERERLKINDINYKPNPVKPIKDTVTKLRAPKKGFTQADVVAAAKEANVSVFVIQAMCVSKGILPNVAVNMIKSAMSASSNEAKS